MAHSVCHQNHQETLTKVGMVFQPYALTLLGSQQSQGHCYVIGMKAQPYVWHCFLSKITRVLSPGLLQHFSLMPSTVGSHHHNNCFCCQQEHDLVACLQ